MFLEGGKRRLQGGIKQKSNNRESPELLNTNDAAFLSKNEKDFNSTTRFARGHKEHREKISIFLNWETTTQEMTASVTMKNSVHNGDLVIR